MTVKISANAVPPDCIATTELRSLASGSIGAAYDGKRLVWLIKNTGNLTLPFQRRDGSVVHIQPGEEAEV